MTWRNVLLSTSNFVALYPFFLCLKHNDKITALLIFASMMSSASFHIMERKMHNLPGIDVIPFDEEPLLFWDRTFAILLFLWIIHEVRKMEWKRDIVALGCIAIFLNCISEFGKYGQSSDEWNVMIYPIFHSAWHLMIFGACNVVLQEKYKFLKENKKK